MLIILLFGLFIGSFLNVLIDRLPEGETVVRGRSHCDYCKKPLRWFELIPLLSFMLQLGRCLRCRRRLSLQYPLIELVTGLGFGYLYLLIAADNPLPLSFLNLFLTMIIFSAFLVIFMIDLKHQIVALPPVIAAATGITGYILVNNSWQTVFTNFLPSAIGTALFFYLFYALSKGYLMGDGDAQLGFLMGLLLGFPKVIAAVYAAFLTGAAVGVILIMAKRKTLKSRVPFGPFLIAGMALALKWQDIILFWWKGVL